VLRNRLEGVLACSGSAPRMRGHPPRLETRDHPTYGEIRNFDLTVVTENGETMVSEELSRGGGCRSPPRGPRAAFHASDREAPSIPVGMLRRLDLARPQGVTHPRHRQPPGRAGLPGPEPRQLGAAGRAGEVPVRPRRPLASTRASCSSLIAEVRRLRSSTKRSSSSVRS
jgi:hypothetical protein